MIIFLYGPDGYRLKQNSDIVLDNYRKKHPGGVFFKYDLSNTGEVIKFEDAVKSGSLFGEVKLIVVKNLFSNKNDSDRVVGLIKSQNLFKEKGTVVLLVENQDKKELVKSKVLFNLLTGKEAMVRNFENLEGENLAKWIMGEFVLRKCSVGPEAMRELIAIAGNDSWVLANEIDKLCNFKMEGVVKKEDVALLGFKKIDLNIFDFVDAMAGKNKARAYEILFKEIKNGRDPYYLLTMMVYQFRNLIIIKDLQKRGYSESEMAKRTKINPFVIKKTTKSPVTFNEAVKTYDRFLTLDTGFKAGKVNLEDSLFGAVVS
ncbi:MAG TPA: DNA polymerase III subunit delta [Candidatus Paceibacterota bacterium]